MSVKKLPMWKVIVFAILPALLLFVIIEGSARVIWSHLEAEALTKDPNKQINFSRVPDSILGYRLAPNYESSESVFATSIGRFHYKFPMHVYVNSGGFAQRDEVNLEKRPGSKRIIAIGESTTEGFHIDQSYPAVLRGLLRNNQNDGGDIEVINAGVSGYISDQWALYAETELFELKPDVVIFYAGWNDFQGYSPHAAVPTQSWFDGAFSYLPGPTHWLRSVSLLSAWLKKNDAENREVSTAAKVDPDILLQSTDIDELQLGLAELKAKMTRYVEKLKAFEAESQKRPDKIEKRKEMIRQLDANIQMVVKKVEAINANPPSAIDQQERVRANYKFFLQNLDRAVAAFQQQNKDVKIVISTLVGRWPYESEAYFLDGANSVWWMKNGGDDSNSAYQALNRFNQLIRDYAHEKDWFLIDSAQAFENVQREEVMWDFCHMTDVGYRMLGQTIYQGLLDQHILSNR